MLPLQLETLIEARRVERLAEAQAWDRMTEGGYVGSLGSEESAGGRLASSSVAAFRRVAGAALVSTGKRIVGTGPCASAGAGC